ncbi:DUF6183 family protein [Actinomadura bangladeshensis]|uniref:Uncharacterized protein n=1 Tax=Actinomadura bangladeshensis TaxID=453573 RepID=A0A6L9Q731_9ACTN|nr:hypothetical protein [Actinomadura bangladeshensis]
MEVGEAVRRMGLADDYRHRHWGRAVKVTDGTVQKAEPGWLEELLRALLEVTEPTYPMRYGFEAALRRLASAPGGMDRTAAVCSLAVEGKAWGEVRYALPEVAGWLACAQPAEHLLAALVDADPADELAACLLQETALRHDAMAASGFAARLKAAGHPLGGMPLRPMVAELDHRLLRYPDRLQPVWGGGESATTAPGLAGLDVTVSEIGWADARRALSAYREWPPGGEAKLFRLDRPLGTEEFGASLLRALPAESAGPTVTRVRRAGTADVLRTLFYGAAGGGAYGPGMHGAYGRVASWESLAALAGVEENDLAAIERAADRCEWLSYTSDWYLHVAPSMDVGIAGLRPDRRTVVILAITDSD